MTSESNDLALASVPLVAGLSPDQVKAAQLFYPYTFEKTIAAFQNQIRFVHYSSAEAAMKMLENGEVWMRKASAMNDFREIDYGKELLIEAYKGEVGQKLKSFLEENFPAFLMISKNFSTGGIRTFSTALI
ncbi:hypothetical protein [Mesorhizobium argentiipisi]|uniref:Uncharacterized protein n=1 Tax=Mesorhizobium argentiipisi TaxID=3015175 RepID=A0ABU8KPJ2_9HYPH